MITMLSTRTRTEPLHSTTVSSSSSSSPSTPPSPSSTTSPTSYFSTFTRKPKPKRALTAPSKARPRPSRSGTSSSASEPYILTLSRPDHRNLVIYGPDEQPLYHIETKGCAKSRSERTLVWQQDSTSSIYPIACLDFYTEINEWREDMIAYDGTRVPLRDVWGKKGRDGTVRAISTPAGEWTWAKTFGGLKLRKTSSKSRVAEYHRNTRIFSASKPTIEIEDTEVDDSDSEAEAEESPDVRREDGSRTEARRRSGTGTGGRNRNRSSALGYLDMIVIGWIAVSRDIELDQAKNSGLG